MKRLIFAAGFGAAVLWTFVNPLPAATVTFTGLVDEIQGQPPGVAIGDTFSGIFFFDPIPISLGGVGGFIDKYSITAGDFTVSGRPNFGNVAFLTDPSQGGVLYQVFNFTDPLSGHYDFMNVGVTLQAGTSGGVIPPFDQFNLNDFYVDLSLANIPDFPPDSLFGHLTSFPTINLNQVPDGGTSMTLLCWGLASLVVLRWGLRTRSAMAARLG